MNSSKEDEVSIQFSTSKVASKLSQYSDGSVGGSLGEKEGRGDTLEMVNKGPGDRAAAQAPRKMLKLGEEELCELEGTIR